MDNANNLEAVLSDAINRIVRIESQLKEWDRSRKPVLYSDEDLCLLSSQKADIEFIREKLETL